MFAIAICWWPLHLHSPHFHGNCKEACLGFLCLTGLTRSFRSELWTSWKAESGVLEAPGLSQRTAPTSPSRDPRGRMRRAVQLHPSRTLRWGGEGVPDDLLSSTKHPRDLPGGPVAGISPATAGSAFSVPGWEARIPHASWPRDQTTEQRQCCNKFNKDLKNGPHQKKNLKKKAS